MSSITEEETVQNQDLRSNNNLIWYFALEKREEMEGVMQ